MYHEAEDKTKEIAELRQRVSDSEDEIVNYRSERESLTNKLEKAQDIVRQKRQEYEALERQYEHALNRINACKNKEE